MGGGHESGGLLVAGDDQLDRGIAQAFDDVEVLLAGHAKDALDALVLERADEQVRSFSHERLLFVLVF